MPTKVLYWFVLFDLGILRDILQEFKEIESSFGIISRKFDNNFIIRRIPIRKVVAVEGRNFKGFYMIEILSIINMSDPRLLRVELGCLEILNSGEESFQ